jgi:hypothetical protein
MILSPLPRRLADILFVAGILSNSDLGTILKKRFTLNRAEWPWPSKGRFHATDTNHSPSDCHRLGSRVDNQIKESEDLEEEAGVRKPGRRPVELRPRVPPVLVGPRPDPCPRYRHSNDRANSSGRVRLDIRSLLRRCIVSGCISYGSSSSWSGDGVCASRQRRRTPRGCRGDF